MWVCCQNMTAITTAPSCFQYEDTSTNVMQEAIHYLQCAVQGAREPGAGGSLCSSCVQRGATAFYTCSASFCPRKMDPWEAEESIPVNMSLRRATFVEFMLKKSLIFLCYMKFNPSFKSLALLTCNTKKIRANAVQPDKWWQRLDCLQICSPEEAPVL